MLRNNQSDELLCRILPPLQHCFCGVRHLALLHHRTQHISPVVRCSASSHVAKHSAAECLGVVQRAPVGVQHHQRVGQPWAAGQQTPADGHEHLVPASQPNLHISLVLATTSTQDEEIGKTLLQIGKVEMFPHFCVTMVLIGGLSYCLAAYQIFAGLEEDQVEAGSDGEVEDDWQDLKAPEDKTLEDAEAWASGSGEGGTIQGNNFLSGSGKKMLGGKKV